MNLISDLISFVKKPFPVEDRELIHIRNTFLIGAFVAVFLFVFEPFGLSTLGSKKLSICAGFGLATVLATLLFSYILSPLLGLSHKQKNFSFGKWILSMIGVLLTISIFNFLFIRSYFGTMRWEFFPQMLFSTVVIGIFPIGLLGALSVNRQEKKYLSIARGINESHHVTQVEKLHHAIFGIDSEEIRYVEAWQNYVKIGYLDREGTFHERTERSTLKQVFEQTEGTNLVKCHRSYLVNRAHIVAVEGNAQGLLLKLENCEKEIPVSRSFVSDFR